MVKITTDTTSMYTVSEGKAMGIDLVPMTLIAGDKSYREIEEINVDELKELIEAGVKLTTSQPAVGEVMDLFEEASEESPILHITMGANFSGAYSSACAVKEMMDDDVKEFITVYESGTVCGINWAMVNIAKDMADKGFSVEEIVKVLDNIKANDRNNMLPQDFAMVQRGGRVSEEERKLDPSLNIVPVLAFNEDRSRFVALGVMPSLKPAIERVIEEFKNTGVDGKYFITIAQSYCMEDAEMAKAMLDEAFPDCSKKIFTLTPVFTVQSGTRCVSIQAFLDPAKNNLY
ncbi:MAG: DegV family EDD domain-containing protein [Oscillospiraceae bacterium]|nr:DegV family EDD domain-containing protein [Oscillospiraceae bacterium]